MFTSKNNSTTVREFSRFLVLYVGLLFLAACGGGSSDSGTSSAPEPTPAPTPAPAPPPPTSVVAIGDSIGTGFGIATPWPPLLADILDAPVNNNSISGEQTNFGVRIIGQRLDEVQPTHVVILLGTNDAIRGSVDNAIANLQTMVDAARNRDVIAIVGTLPPITRSASEDARAQQINAGIRGLSGARIADLRATVSRNMIADGVHPNQMGQQIIADTFANAF